MRGAGRGMPQVAAGATPAPDADACGLSTKELKEKLKELGLPHAGIKAELIARYHAAIKGTTADVIGDGEDEPLVPLAAPRAAARAPQAPGEINGALPDTPADPASLTPLPATSAELAKGLNTRTPAGPAETSSPTPGELRPGAPHTPAEISKASPGSPAEPAKPAPGTPAEITKAPKTPAEIAGSAPPSPADIAEGALGSPGSPGAPAEAAPAEEPALVAAPLPQPGDTAHTEAELGGAGEKGDVATGAADGAGGVAAGAVPDAEKEMEDMLWKATGWDNSEDEPLLSPASKPQKRKRPSEGGAEENEMPLEKDVEASPKESENVNGKEPAEAPPPAEAGPEHGSDAAWQKEWHKDGCEKNWGDQQEQGKKRDWEEQGADDDEASWKKRKQETEKDTGNATEEGADKAEAGKDGKENSEDQDPKDGAQDYGEDENEKEEPLEDRVWELDDGWQQLWPPNSDEAKVATYIVQKIRARTEAEGEVRMKVPVKGFKLTSEPVNGDYVQQGFHEGRPFFENCDGTFFIYCSARKWCLAQQLGGPDTEAWAVGPPPPLQAEGQTRILVPKMPPPGSWKVNIAFASGNPELGTASRAEPEFPSREAGEAFLRLVTQQHGDQRALVAALLWIEANVLEVTTVPPNVSEAAVVLLNTEEQALRAVCSRVPVATMVAKATSAIPLPEVRRYAKTVVQELTTKLHQKLGGTERFGELEKFEEIVVEVLGQVPTSVRILALVHAHEFSELRPSTSYRDAEALAVAFAKQCLPERAVETTCRLSLHNAIGLAEVTLGKTGVNVQNFRDGKNSSMNRLFQEWNLNPTEDQISQLHVFELKTQLKILLLIERDIERFWARTISMLKTEEERNQRLREFLDFDKLLHCQLSDDNLMTSQDLEKESGQTFDIFHIARARKSVADVLKKLKSRYGWSPSLSTRVKMSKTNWIARLSALLLLANSEACIDADLKLRVLLQQESARSLGMEILVRFDQWYMLETDDGIIVKTPKVLDKSRAEQVDKMYNEYERKQGKRFGPQGYQPMTPSGVGMFNAGPGTPRMGSMTPGLPVSGTPYRLSGTPAGPPPATPAWAGMAAGRTPAGAPPPTPFGLPPGTPAGMPPASPAFQAYPGTPSGPPPATPGLAGFTGGRTPAGPPPATPAAYGLRQYPGTPAGPPPATPMGPFSRPPGSPAGPPPATPARPQMGLPQTPSGFVPMTPRAAYNPQTPGSAVPMTPAAYNAVPFTPAPFSAAPSTPRASAAVTSTSRGVPANPRAAVPSTPRGAAPFTPGAIMPFTPMGPRLSGFGVPSTPSHHIVPSTPRGLSAFRPSAPSTPAGAMPFTPAGFAVPQTPAAASAPQTPRAAAASVPMTPRGAIPGTPRGALPVPFTPAGPPPFTPAGPPPATPGGPLPFTPAGYVLAPATPAGPVLAPFTPAGPAGTVLAPATPAGPMLAPFTPAGPMLAPFTPAGPMQAPATPAGPMLAPATPAGPLPAPATPLGPVPSTPMASALLQR